MRTLAMEVEGVGCVGKFRRPCSRFETMACVAVTICYDDGLVKEWSWERAAGEPIEDATDRLFEVAVEAQSCLEGQRGTNSMTHDVYRLLETVAGL